MMAFLRKMLRITPSAPGIAPITYRDVPPAARDPEKERQIKEAQTALVQDKMRLDRRAWEIRQTLVGNVIEIVSGDHQ